MIQERRYFLLFAFLLSACAAPQRSWSEILPATAGPWSRKTVKALPENEFLTTIKAQGPISAAKADYESSGVSITAIIYDLKVETSAFEAIQKWPPQSGPAVYKGKYFLTRKLTHRRRPRAFAVPPNSAVRNRVVCRHRSRRRGPTRTARFPLAAITSTSPPQNSDSNGSDNLRPITTPAANGENAGKIVHPSEVKKPAPSARPLRYPPPR